MMPGAWNALLRPAHTKSVCIVLHLLGKSDKRGTDDTSDEYIRICFCNVHIFDLNFDDIN